MNDYLTSLIRTYVPLGVAYLVGWLASLGINVTDSQREAIAGAIGVVAAGLYYALIRKLEAKFPKVGILLGKPAAVSYSAPQVTDASKHAA